MKPDAPTVVRRTAPHPAPSPSLRRDLLIAIATCASSLGFASAQGVNVDFGSSGSPPASVYGGAGAQPGYWNRVASVGTFETLLDLAGGLTPVTLRASATGFYSFDNPATIGDDERLLDRFLDGPAAVTLRGLAPGRYDLFVYAWAPDSPQWFTEVTVVGALDPPQRCGGAWSGAHVLGASFTRHAVVVGASTQEVEVLFFGSTCNGLQVVPAGSAPLGASFCAPVANSTGRSGELFAVGSPAVATNDLTLIATRLPVNALGYFVTGTARASVANPGGSQGVLCVGGTLGRFSAPGQVQTAGAAGALALRIDLTRVPTATGNVAVLVGETRVFQAWHRDTANGGATSNFTRGVELTFQ